MTIPKQKSTGAVCEPPRCFDHRGRSLVLWSKDRFEPNIRWKMPFAIGQTGRECPILRQIRKLLPFGTLKVFCPLREGRFLFMLNPNASRRQIQWSRVPCKKASHDLKSNPERTVRNLTKTADLMNASITMKPATAPPDNTGGAVAVFSLFRNRSSFRYGKRITCLAASCEIRKYESLGKRPVRWRCSDGGSG